MNITQGDNSFIPGAVDFGARPPASSDAGATAGASVEAAPGAGVETTGAAAIGAAGAIALGCDAAAGRGAAAGGWVCCWAKTGAASQLAVSTTAATRLAWSDVIFILRPSSE